MNSSLDQSSRRISLIGTIHSKPALVVLERAAFPSDSTTINSLLERIINLNVIGANDIYSWLTANIQPAAGADGLPPDLKVNVIYPCTDSHIKKYSAQKLRVVTETPEIYQLYVRPYMRKKREEGRLNWVFNILDGKAEQEDVMLRESSGTPEGFLLTPDLNWDRKTLTSLHLLALVERRDVWSLRDLRTEHVPWLKKMREKVVNAAIHVYPDVERDELKLYVHYQPTYYHFHIHIVHVMLEAGNTQAVGKAFGLENIIGQLEAMLQHRGPDDNAGLDDLSLTYHLGEQSELWTEIFGKLKKGHQPEIS